jgi:hypothetical protein
LAWHILPEKGGRPRVVLAPTLSEATAKAVQEGMEIIEIRWIAPLF